MLFTTSNDFARELMPLQPDSGKPPSPEAARPAQMMVNELVEAALIPGPSSVAR